MQIFIDKVDDRTMYVKLNKNAEHSSGWNQSSFNSRETPDLSHTSEMSIHNHTIGLLKNVFPDKHMISKHKNIM